MRRSLATPDIKVGDTVQRITNVGTNTQTGELSGEVIRVTPRRKGAIGLGGVRALCQVRWENGYIGRCEDRVLKVVLR